MTSRSTLNSQLPTPKIHSLEVGGWALGIITCALVSACGGSSHVTGHVTQLQGGPLGGAVVTIDGARTHAQVSADPAGRFDFPGLNAGTYAVKAEQPGFVMETHADLAVARGAIANTDFVLHPACLEEGSYVDGGLGWALQAAEAVVYVRLGTPSSPDRWIVNDQCVVGIDHPATVLSILNMGPSSGDITKTIHILKDGRTALTAGDEYIAFIRWEPAVGRYRPIAGPIFMIPVRDGKVAWNRADASNIRNGDAVGKAMASLFALLPSARGKR